MRGKRVALETSGERDISGVDPRVKRIVDLKAPGSGEEAKNRWENIEVLNAHDEIKIVIADRTDFEWAVSKASEFLLHQKVAEVLLSPVWGELDPQTLARWMLDSAFIGRMQVQLHKYVWGDEATGV